MYSLLTAISVVKVALVIMVAAFIIIIIIAAVIEKAVAIAVEVAVVMATYCVRSMPTIDADGVNFDVKINISFNNFL